MNDLAVTLSPGWIAATIAAITVQIIAPPIIAIVAGRRLRVGWRFFAYGALIFLVFQILTRIPLTQVGQTLLQGPLSASPMLMWGWITGLSFSAGLFEEIGRWVGYRWLFRPAQRGWREGVMYGLGHGGLESMVLVAGLSALSLAGVLSIQGSDALAQLPPEQREVAQGQFTALAAQPVWYPLLGAWERLSALALHVGLSLIVLRAFQRRSFWWVGMAILIHGAVNFVGVGMWRVLGEGLLGAVVDELAITAMAVTVVWYALRLYCARRHADI